MTKLKRPVRRVAVCKVPHGVNPSLVIALYPGGVIGLREARRRKEYQIAAGELYARLVFIDASKTKGEWRARRRAR